MRITRRHLSGTNNVEIRKKSGKIKNNWKEKIVNIA